MKDKILRKLTRLSHKNKLLRLPILAVIFVFLAVCHLFRYIYNKRWRLCGAFCVVLVFLLSSSFALPILLDIDYEGTTTGAVYESDLETMMQSGELDDIVLDDNLLDDGFEDYEDYNPEEMDTYSMDEILKANEELLNARGEETQTTETDENGEIVFSADDWKLLLVNKQHPIPDDYTFTLTTITGSMQCDERILPDLLAMLQQAKEDGVSLIICSPYRDMTKQVYLFERKIRAYMNRGLNYMDAYKMTSQAVTVPGASEHQLGLSLDIYTASYLVLDDGFGETRAGLWLAEHSWEYGFILRYPRDKEYITGIGYEPWHFRYVGYEAAKIMKEEGLTLEEFWDQYVK